MLGKGKPFVIYGLAEPRGRNANLIRYVGQTRRFHQRMREHINITINTKTHVGCWLKRLKRKGYTPKIIILDRCTLANVNSSERWHIRWWAYSGQLTNHNEGGVNGRLIGAAGEATRIKIGKTNYKHLKFCREDPVIHQKAIANRDAFWTQANRAAFSAKAKIRFSDKTTRKKMSESAKARFAKPENLEEKRRIAKVQFSNPANRKKLSKMLKARWRDPNWRNMVMKSFHDPKSRARRSASAKARWETARRKANG